MRCFYAVYSQGQIGETVFSQSLKSSEALSEIKDVDIFVQYCLVENVTN